MDDPRKLTMADLFDAWIEHNSARWAPATIAANASNVRTLRHHVGSVLVTALTTRQIDGVYRDLEHGRRPYGRCGRSLAQSTVHRLHSTLSAALSQAVRW